MQAPASGDDWFVLSEQPLPVGEVHEWAGRRDCGAIVVFTGMVRDHSEGRPCVESLEYEAYETVVLQRFEEIASEARRRWPTIGRVAQLHRVGLLTLGETAVVVAVSAPHRSEAFEAARFAIDTLKLSAPLWKHETWRDGEGWGSDAAEISAVPSAGTSR